MCALGASINAPVHADSTELEVYRSELADEGEFNVDFAGNVMRTPRHSDLAGQAVTQAVGELSYGLDDGYQIGLKLPVTYSNGAWYGKSLLGELKYVAPHEKTGWYWGAEVELGYVSAIEENQKWAAEITPIFGYRIDKWELTLDPGMSITSGGDGHGVAAFEPSAKASYLIARETAIGIEYFSEAGPLRAMLPGRERNELAFLAVDTKIGKSIINLGLGHGVNSYSPGFALKVVMDLEFD
jgi:hypothetical protein